MDHQKWIGRSMTAWGTLITILSTAGPVLGPLVGGEVNPAEVSDLGAKGTAWFAATGAFIGSALAVWGRFRARSKVTVLPKFGA